MKYRNRQGQEFEQTTGQDKLLRKMYDSYFCRAFLRFLSIPAFSKLAGALLDSKLSASFISDFAENNNIDLSEYEPRLTSRSTISLSAKSESRAADRCQRTRNVLISPSDGKVTAYEIDKVNGFVIKNSVYTYAAFCVTKSLQRDMRTAMR